MLYFSSRGLINAIPSHWMTPLHIWPLFTWLTAQLNQSGFSGLPSISMASNALLSLTLSTHDCASLSSHWTLSPFRNISSGLARTVSLLLFCLPPSPHRLIQSPACSNEHLLIEYVKPSASPNHNSMVLVKSSYKTTDRYFYFYLTADLSGLIQPAKCGELINVS